MNSEVDVNILVSLYNQKISALTNQNILLEAKLQSLTKDFEDQKNILLRTNLELQQHNDEILKSKRKVKSEDKYEEAGIQQ
jgi:hypothetical protein